MVVAVAGVLIALSRPGSPTDTTPGTAPNMGTATATASPPPIAGFTRPPSLPGGDPVADQALWDTLGGTGLVWDDCGYQSNLGMAISRLDCSNVDPALELRIAFLRYADEAALRAEQDQIELEAGGDDGECTAGGRFVGTVGPWELVCGTVLLADGTESYSIFWTDPVKLTAGQLWDSDPVLAYEWWFNHTPF